MVRRTALALFIVLIALVGLTGTMSLHAQSGSSGRKAMVAACDAGGCRCMVSSLTVEEMEVMFGELAPANAADQVLVFASGGVSWVASPFRDIHRSFGGSGECPIELFPLAAAKADDGARIPRDGMWEMRNVTADYSGCPRAAQFHQPAPEKKRIRINWGGRFDPGRSFPPIPGITWSKVDDNYWVGRRDYSGFVVLQHARLVDSRTIRVTGDVQVPQQVQRMVNVRCMFAQADYSLHWIGE